MGVFKSLGLSPAKKAGAATSKAFRRLFGRVLPAGGGREEVAASTSSTSASTTATGANSYDEDESNKNNKIGKDGHQNKDTSAVSRPGREPREPQDPQLSSTTRTTNSDPSTTLTTITPDKMTQVSHQSLQKENQPPGLAAATDALAGLSLNDEKLAPATPIVPAPINEDPAVVAEREKNLRFIEEALDMARLALRTNETPVGCVLVHEDKVIARGMNATNVTRNGTRHAEFMALSALLSYPPKGGPRATCLKPKVGKPKVEKKEKIEADALDAASDAASVESRPPDEGNEDGSKGHLYPYGQKLHPAEKVDRAIIRESILYVTVEPCVMCASLLRQLGIKKVYFGAVNDKFGGTGGVFSIHANSFPIRPDGQTAAAHPTPRPSQLPDGSGTLGVSFPPGGGDGGNIEAGYEIEGGWGRDEAVALLRRFYVQENGRAPVPRKKEGRAARLAAMMEKDGDVSPDGAGAALIDGDGLPAAADVLEENLDPLADGRRSPADADDMDALAVIDAKDFGETVNGGLIR
ncbi:Fc.00g035560.m01.CDS01 [Cosmosporella sp. VM-42]